MSQVLSYLNTVPLAGLMLVVTLGFLLGRLRFRDLSLGPAGGTLGIAILFGAAGLDFSGLYATEEPLITVGLFGFALFIYSVGFEAGPRFFASLKGGKGWQFPFLGVVVNVVALALAVVCGHLLDLGESVTAGLLAGALTSTPTYAAAVEVCDDPAALAVAFALTFPLGLVGVVLMAGFLPRLMGDDLAAGTSALDEDDEERAVSPELRRAFEVRRDEVIGRPLSELDLLRRTGCYVTRHHRGHRVTVPDADTRLERGDHVMAKGHLGQLRAFERLVGPEIYDEDLRRRLPSARAIQVTSGEVVGRSLREIRLFKEHHCLVTGILRHGVAIEPTAERRLFRDDVVLVAGHRDDVRAVARLLGRFERSRRETDIAIYAGGILAGLLLGELRYTGFGFDLGLGTAGGLLLTGVLLGRFRRIGPFSAHVPPAARQLVRDLGILLFVGETGVEAGGGSFSGVEGVVGGMLACGALVTAVPVVTAVLVGRRILTMRPVDAWGSVCGGMTSSSALVAIRNAADSSEPAISYAASYAVASVLATLAGQVVVLLI